MRLQQLVSIFHSAVLGAALLACAQACAQEAAQPSSQPAPPGGQVIFSRSENSSDGAASPSNAVTANQKQVPPQVSGQSPPQVATPPQVPPMTDAERRPVSFLSYDLDVRLHPKEQGMAVRARMVLRNDDDRPMARLPLQISSTLHWVSIRLDGKDASFSQQLIKSDADHTGALDEAIVSLAQPLAPGQTIKADVVYEGSLGPSYARLENIGTPPDVAMRSDWDQVSDSFVGLRGFGNVVWYPVVSKPVALGDGDKFFTEVAAQKLRQSGALVSMRVTEEFFNTPPNIAVLDGNVLPLVPASLPSTAGVPGITTCTLPKTRLGFNSPSLFLLNRTEATDNGLRLYTTSQDSFNAQTYMAASRLVQPLISRWLGSRSKTPLTIVDLPDADDAPFEANTVVFTGMAETDPNQLTGMLVHSLTHSHFNSPYPWLNEGVASFMATLWVEQTSGRNAAITEMDNSRGALSLVEPEIGPVQPVALSAKLPATANSGESLLAAKDAIYYRTKATYVFWMLRDLAGDDALAAAFQAYNPAQDVDGMEFERVLERASGKDLKWFFDGWVYHDRGLPDLSISGVYPNTASIPGSFIVAVDVSNSGDVEADVPVSVRSDVTSVTAHLRVPANSRITHRFVLAGQPLEVAVNDGTVPEVEASMHVHELSDQP